MAEAGGLNPLQHGFESHRGHCIGLPRSPSSLCLMARFARCDLRRGAAVFVGSDETIVSENQLCSGFVSSAPPADRRREHRGRGTRWEAAVIVVARGRKACPLAPPQHGGARSGIGLPRSLALASRCKPRRFSAQGDECSSDRTHSLLICGLVRRTAAAESASQHHSFFKAWKKGWSSFVHLN
jgi:hypothetical protein